MTNKTLVIGSGEWGSALASVLGAETLAGRADATKISAQIVVVACNSQSVREVLQKHSFGKATLVIAAKGFELSSQKLLSQVAAECLPENEVTVLSGPNFAVEVAAGLPAVATIAAENLATASALCDELSRKTFRLYPSGDIISTQIAGAVKNVIAIATGIAAGAGLGENARAAIITRALAEISRLCVALGGEAKTLLQPAGVGDLFLTCSSEKSRNFRFGLAIGKAGKFEKTPEFLCEGYFAVEAIVKLAIQQKIEMPICNSVFEVIYNKNGVYEQIDRLLERARA